MKCTETPFRALARIKLGQQKCLYLGNLDSRRAMIEATARLRGQITVKEVQIGAMRTFATEGNPQLQLAQQELEAMKRELAKIEGAGGAKVGEGNAGNGQGIDNLRLLRDMKYYETIYELLAKQYDLAKIDEAKDSAIVQVMEGHRARPQVQAQARADRAALHFGSWLQFVW